MKQGLDCRNLLESNMPEAEEKEGRDSEREERSGHLVRAKSNSSRDRYEKKWHS